MAGLWDVLVGAATGVAGQAEKSQEQKRKLQQIAAEQQAKQLYPDAQEQARQKVLQLIGQLQPEPTLGNQPQISVSPTATPEQRQMMQLRWIEPIRQRVEQQNAPLLSLMDQLKSLYAPAQTGMTQVFGMSPVTGRLESKGAIPHSAKIAPTPLTNQQIQEKAAAQARGTAQGKSEIDVPKQVQRFQQGLEVIQSTLNDVNQTTSRYLQRHPPIFTTEAHVRRRLGTYDPTFRRADSAIKAQLGNFLKTVEGIPGFRLAAAEFKSLGQILTDLPYLAPADQNKNLQVIHQLLSTIQGKLGTASLNDDEEALIENLLGS